jgi:GNAT superfamily N-acetyltransferase
MILRIRQIAQSEIPQLQNFPPEDWNLDLPRLFSFHFGQSYFYPIVAEVNNRIVGCGIGILHGTISWLGTIIVLPEYRRQGIGQKITKHLIQYCREQGCTTQLLTASEMGEPLYKKLGFRTNLVYEFYRRPSAVSYPQKLQVRKIQQEDIVSIRNLDREITGEERFPFLERFFSTGWVYVSEEAGSVRGIFLPEYGTGLILAKDSEAGIELMKLRLNGGKLTTVIPSANASAREFLETGKFQIYRITPRMFLGDEVKWQPALLYNRATGYSG